MGRRIIKEQAEITKELDFLLRKALSQRVAKAQPSSLLWWRIKRDLSSFAPPSFLSWQLLLPALEKAHAHYLSFGYSTYLL